MPQSSGRKRKRILPAKQDEHLVARDPLTYLNIDIINIILTYLTLPDLVRCERVSKNWKNIIESWIVTSGLRLRFPHAWVPDKPMRPSGPQAYDEFKLQARHYETLRSGRPSSVFRFDNVSCFVSSGDYVAWQSKFNIPRSHYHHSFTDRIYWQCIARDGAQSVDEPKVIRAAQLFRPAGSHAYIAGIALNSDGILLINFQLDYTHHELSCARSVVYSTVERKILWRRDHQERSNKHPNPSIFPLLIGKHTLYCASKNCENEHTLCAFDFRTNARLYQSATKIETNWWDYLVSNEFSPTTSERMRILQATDGEELLLQLAHDNEKESYRSRVRGYIQLINGSSGHIIQRIDFPEAKLDSFLRQPFTDNAVIVSELTQLPKSLYDTNNPLLFQRLIILRKLPRILGGSPDPWHTDFLFAPRDCLIRPNPHPQSPLTIHPFHKLALVSSEQIKPLSGNEWTMWSRPLIPTSDNSHRDLAKHLLTLVFPFEPPILDECFVLGGKTQVTLPPSLQRGREGRIRLRLPKGPTERAQFIERGRVLLSSDNSETKYLINFS